MKRILQNLIANKTDRYLVKYAFLMMCAAGGSYVSGIYWASHLH
ncbi:MAG TPA: hypothetical protein VLY24_18855 [Bryobacteraceae bacterium]|nr:hypothetical protein [Bryobacteraceae bacterium]